MNYKRSDIPALKRNIKRISKARDLIVEAQDLISSREYESVGENNIDKTAQDCAYALRSLFFLLGGALFNAYTTINQLKKEDKEQ